MSALDPWLPALTRHGYTIENPRPRFAPLVEQALEDEMEEQVRHGEKEPTPTAALPGNVYLLRKGRVQFLIYALQSALDDGFWGVNHTVISELKSQPLPWVLVLLNAVAEGGHWFAGSQVLKRIGRQWPPIIAGGPNYEVRAPQGVAGGKPFQAAEEFLELVSHLTP